MNMWLQRVVDTCEDGCMALSCNLVLPYVSQQHEHRILESNSRVSISLEGLDWNIV